MGFKLLLLPFIALECVLKRMDGLDLIVFASISKKTMRCTKAMKRRIPSIDTTLGIRFFEQIVVRFFKKKCEEDEEEFEKRTDKYEKDEEESKQSYIFKFCDYRAGKDIEFPFCTFILDGVTLIMTKTLVAQKTICTFYSKDRTLAATKFIEFLYQTFKPINFDLALENSIRAQFENFVGWHLLSEVQNLGFHVSFKVADEQFKMFHDTVRQVPRQSLALTFPENTNKNHGITATFDEDVLSIHGAAWFKKADFDLLNVRFLDLEQSELVNEDVRYILQKWMTTVSWRLEKAEIEMDEPDLDVILGGFEVMSTAQLKKRFPQLKNKELEFDHGRIDYHQDGAKHLLRTDSTIATIQLAVRQKTLCFSAWTI